MARYTRTVSMDFPISSLGVSHLSINRFPHEPPHASYSQQDYRHDLLNMLYQNQSDFHTSSQVNNVEFPTDLFHQILNQMIDEQREREARLQGRGFTSNESMKDIIDNFERQQLALFARRFKPATPNIMLE